MNAKIRCSATKANEWSCAQRNEKPYMADERATLHKFMWLHFHSLTWITLYFLILHKLSELVSKPLGSFWMWLFRSMTSVVCLGWSAQICMTSCICKTIHLAQSYKYCTVVDHPDFSDSNSISSLSMCLLWTETGTVSFLCDSALWELAATSPRFAWQYFFSTYSL